MMTLAEIEALEQLLASSKKKYQDLANFSLAMTNSATALLRMAREAIAAREWLGDVIHGYGCNTRGDLFATYCAIVEKHEREGKK